MNQGTFLWNDTDSLAFQIDACDGSVITQGIDYAPT
jgi:hypothetical protein